MSTVYRPGPWRLVRGSMDLHKMLPVKLKIYGRDFKMQRGIKLLIYVIHQILGRWGQPPIGSGVGHAFMAAPWAVISTADRDGLGCSDLNEVHTYGFVMARQIRSSHLWQQGRLTTGWRWWCPTVAARQRWGGALTRLRTVKPVGRLW
jgi:hypothetical protein